MTQTENLLYDLDFFKEFTSISDNLMAKYLKPSVWEAQEIHLRRVLGDALLNKCKSLNADHDLDNHPAYKELVGMTKYFVAYVVLADLPVRTSYKISNAGLVKTSDENVEVASWDEMAKNRVYYEAKADAMCYQLQGWLIEHKSDFPELNENECRRIQSNLYSAATCGIWLGGSRGKTRRGR